MEPRSESWQQGSENDRKNEGRESILYLVELPSPPKICCYLGD